MWEDFYTVNKLAQAEHQLRLHRAAQARTHRAQLRELAAKKRLAKAIRAAQAAGLPPEELQALFQRALRAVS